MFSSTIPRLLMPTDSYTVEDAFRLVFGISKGLFAGFNLFLQKQNIFAKTTYVKTNVNLLHRFYFDEMS